MRSADYRLTLAVEGRETPLTLDDLRAMPQTIRELPIACVEGWSASATWTGVRLRDLLARAGHSGGRDARVISLDRGLYGVTVLPANFADADDTLIALRLNDEELNLDHGFPCRLIAPTGRVCCRRSGCPGSRSCDGRSARAPGARRHRMAAYGVTLITDFTPRDQLSVVIWAIAGLLVHDAILAPTYSILGHAGSRSCRRQCGHPSSSRPRPRWCWSCAGSAGSRPAPRGRTAPELHHPRPALRAGAGDRGDPHLGAGRRRGGPQPPFRTPPDGAHGVRDLGAHARAPDRGRGRPGQQSRRVGGYRDLHVESVDEPVGTAGDQTRELPTQSRHLRAHRDDP